MINDHRRPGSSEGQPFFCYLPPYLGILAKLILKLLFIRPKVDANLEKTIKEVNSSGIVVFVNKYRSEFEYFFYSTRFRHEGLPYPGIGFDYSTLFWQPIGRLVRGLIFHIKYFLKHFSLPDPYEQHYYRRKLLDGESALLSLIEEKGFYRRLVESKTDPIDYLIEMQKTIHEPIYLVPQLILYDRTPQTTRLSFLDMVFGTRERPGRLRRLFMMLKRPGKILIEASDPVSLKDFLQSPDVEDLSHRNQAIYLRRYLLDQINRHRQSITGPVLKAREEIMEGVLTKAYVQKAIAEHAKESGLSLYQAQKEAAEYLDEIASNYNLKMIRVFDVVLRWIIRAMFDGMVVDYEGLNRVKQASKNAPLILVPCHKSHLDYLIISYVFFHNNMPCPHIAAGKNLSFWPLGPIFRGGGAFFLRRTFKGETLYPQIFSAYLHKIIEEGFHIEFFIEGGRSRTGKLLAPKIGFLSLIVDAFMKSQWEDLNFVPIYIGYDRVLEEKAYVHELEGGKKAPENISNVLKARKFLKKKFGKIYINFNDPLSLNEFLAQAPSAYPELERTEQKRQIYEFGEKIVSAINQESVVTPHAVIAAAILNCAQKRIYYKQLIVNAETYMAHLFAKNIKLADTLYIDRQSAFDYVLDTFVNNKFLEQTAATSPSGARPNPIYKIHENKRPNLEYYKNNSVIFFIPAAYTALSILATDAFQFTANDLHAHYNFLKDFFEEEFIFDPEDTTELAVRKNLKAFIDDAILIPHPTLPDTYNLTSAGFRKLNLFAGFLTPYFDAYWVVLNFYMRYTRQSILDIKDYIKKIQNMGTRMYKRNEIIRKEALSKINYKNAVTHFTTRGLTNPEHDKEILDGYVEKIQKYRKFLPH